MFCQIIECENVVTRFCKDWEMNVFHLKNLLTESENTKLKKKVKEFRLKCKRKGLLKSNHHHWNTEQVG